MGEGPLDGVWFGDIHKGLPGAFWWRGLLKAAAGWPEPPAMDLRGDRRAENRGAAQERLAARAARAY